MDTRYSARTPTTGTVTVCCEDRVRGGTILDLSVPGCLLATSLPLHKGQSVRLDIYLSHHPPLRIDLGVVRWAANGEAGIEFIRMPDADAARLRWYAGEVEKNAPQSDGGARRAQACAP